MSEENKIIELLKWKESMDLKLRDRDKKIAELESRLNEIDDRTSGSIKIGAQIGAGGNPKEKVHDMSFQDIDLDKESTIDYNDFKEALERGEVPYKHILNTRTKPTTDDPAKTSKIFIEADEKGCDITLPDGKLYSMGIEIYNALKYHFGEEFVKDLNEIIRIFDANDFGHGIYKLNELIEKWQKK
ncbi:MAG: hypothetical protein ACFFG0_18580 [Candidatus Thorarchaeota archaeon]